MTKLPLPEFFNPNRVGEIWKVDYAARAEDGRKYALQHDLKPASASKENIALLLIDVQNTFCMPGFELFVGGRSGTGAVDDNVRLCEFIYRNLGTITQIVPTLDTHSPLQIFHAAFLVDDDGRHPDPLDRKSTRLNSSHGY